MLKTHVIHKATLLLYGETSDVVVKITRVIGARRKELCQLQTKKGEWTYTNISMDIKNWVRTLDGERFHKYIIKARCGQQECFNIEKMPLMKIVYHAKAKSRSKRYGDCVPGGTECCREYIKIPMELFRLDGWILKPNDMNYYYCSGSCVNHRKSVYGEMISSLKYNSSINTCCVPTKYKGLAFMLINNFTMYEKYLFDIMPEECGCIES